MKSNRERVFRTLNLVAAVGAAGVLSACESPYSFLASVEQGALSVQQAGVVPPKDPVAEPSSAPEITSVETAGVKDGSAGCVGATCAPSFSSDPSVSLDDPSSACASLRSSELQVINNNGSGSVIGERGRSSINLASISEMSNDHGRFDVNANHLVQLGGDIRGNFHIYAGSVERVSDAQGFMAIVNRNHEVAGVDDVISEISGFRGNLLICGFNVNVLSDFQGRLRVMGGMVSHLEDTHGSLVINGQRQ